MTDWFDDTKGVDLHRADVRRILNDLGVAYRERGQGDFWYNCIFPDHSERKPSAHIRHNPGRDYHGVFHCFGCGKSGNILKFVELASGKGKAASIAFIRERLLDFVPRTKRVRAVRSEISLPKEFEFYPERDKWNPPYVEYLEERGIIWDQVAKHKIGYCDGGEYVFRIVVPIYLGRELCSWVARTIRGERNRVLACPNGKPGLFGSQFASPSKGPAIICEGWTDALAVERAGFQNCMSLQTNSFHPSQLDFLSDWKEVVIVPDGDDGGRRLWNAASQLLAYSTVHVARIPEGEDPGSLSETRIIGIMEKLERWKPVVRNWEELLEIG